MLKTLLIAGAAVALAVPAVSNAATRCRQQNRNNEATGTVVGAVAGGFIGNALSSGRNRGTGTAIGAVGGAIIGNRIAASGNQPCPAGYEAYEDGLVQDGYAQQSQYQDGYRAPQGQPVYDEHRYDSYQQPAYQQPSYQAYQQPSYQAYQQPAYQQPSYSQSYSYQQPSDEQRSYNYSSGQSSAYVQPSYSDDQNQGYTGSQQYWQDAYGRTCHWSYSRRSANWRQVCR